MTTNGTSQSITTASLDLFLSLAIDAGEWSGSPLVTVSPAERGNLTQLKRAGLITTWTDEEDGCVFAVFTDAGKALAAERGVDLSWIGR